jgi:hypothetical protein
MNTTKTAKMEKAATEDSILSYIPPPLDSRADCFTSTAFNMMQYPNIANTAYMIALLAWLYTTKPTQRSKI